MERSGHGCIPRERWTKESLHWRSAGVVSRRRWRRSPSRRLKIVENWTCLRALERKIWKMNPKNGVMYEDLVQNGVMDANIDPKVVMDAKHESGLAVNTRSWGKYPSLPSPESSSFFQDLIPLKRGFCYWACNITSCIHLIILFELFTMRLQNCCDQFWRVRVQQRSLHLKA